MTKIRQWLADRLVPEARYWWRLWSLRLEALGLALISWIKFDPVSVLAVWNMMPAAVRKVVPFEALFGIGLTLFVLSMVARLVKQPKLNRRWDDPK